VASVPTVIDLAKRARAAGVKVVYSVTAISTPKDILPGLEPQKGEPYVKAAADKFFKTDLDEILKKFGAKTVILTGFRSQGAIIATGTEAAYRGYKVVLPVDGMSSDVPYAKQYVTWNMMNAPGAVGHVTETTAAGISFGK
jgi:nicotinamidase-related amidase